MAITGTGRPAAGVALMGCTMSATQEKLLADQFGQVVVTLDGDEAGRAATEEIGDHLQRRIFRVKTVELDEGMQPD